LIDSNTVGSDGSVNYNIYSIKKCTVMMVIIRFVVDHTTEGIWKMFRGPLIPRESGCPDWNKTDLEALLSGWVRHVPHVASH
jgi:hypothetical protein